jgi:hypothetical protein
MIKKIFISLILLLLLPTSVSANHPAPLKCEVFGGDEYCKNAPGTKYCDKNDHTLICKKGGYCDPHHLNHDENDGCVRSCVVDTSNELRCEGGQPAQAGSFKGVFGTVNAPSELSNLVEAGGDTGAGSITLFLNNLISIIYSLIVFIFLFMLIFAAFQWITAGGDKEAVAKARARITNAIIGLIILALAFFITRFTGQLLGFKWL